jgi:hypothetical protein
MVANATLAGCSQGEDDDDDVVKHGQFFYFLALCSHFFLRELFQYLFETDGLAFYQAETCMYSLPAAIVAPLGQPVITNTAWLLSQPSNNNKSSCTTAKPRKDSYSKLIPPHDTM